MRLLRSAILGASLVVLSAPAAYGQTDADKATARSLAREGMRLKAEERFAQALDKLERAQRIFDAPTHLLLIAQCQVALGKLIEGAETYRELARRDVSGSEAFKNAQRQGGRELGPVEERIPAIRIDIEPEAVYGLKVSIDGQEVPLAIVGVDRVVNPGKHVIQASAAGYGTATIEVEVAEREKKPVKVQLRRVGEGGATLGTGEPSPPGQGQGGEQPEPTGPRMANHLGLMGTLRLKGNVLLGDLGEATHTVGTYDGGQAPDAFGPGGGFEMQAGLRFANHFAGAFIFGFDFFTPRATNLEARARPLLGGTDYKADTARSAFVGAAFQYYSCRDCLGLVAELAVMERWLSQRISLTNRFPCEVDVGWSAPMLRATVGLGLRPHPLVRVMPFLSGAIGQVTSNSVDATQCSAPIDVKSGDFTDQGPLFNLSGGVSGSFIWDFDRPH